MQMSFQDRAPLEKVRRLADGRIAAVAKFARTGTYTYTGAEVGRPDLATVTVYRPEDEVFAQDAMASFAHQAITLGHPADGVSPRNWSKVSVGFTEGRVARDGAFVEIPLMLADASAVKAYDTGSARELSAGYQCELTWGDGVAPDGTRYQATQRAIRGNHIALVAQGRAGDQCRIGDSMQNDATMFTDADRGLIVTQAKAEFDLNNRYLGDRAPQFTDAMAQAALATEANARQQRGAMVSRHMADANALYAADHTAAQKAADDLNAWRR